MRTPARTPDNASGYPGAGRRSTRQNAGNTVDFTLSDQPRPTNGILEAITVIVKTFASIGRLAMLVLAAFVADQLGYIKFITPQ